MELVLLGIVVLLAVSTTYLIHSKEVKSMEMEASQEEVIKKKESANPNSDKRNSPEDSAPSKEFIIPEKIQPEQTKPSNSINEDNKQESQTITQTNQTVYLTFDDGPNKQTEGILQLLEKYGAKATFFMLEPNMEKFKDSIAKMVTDGHAIGLHGVTHDVKKIYQSSQSVVNEMKIGQSTLESISGVQSNLIRVPYGSVPHMKPNYFEAVEAVGFKLWDWNVDSKDWKFTSEKYVHHILAQLESNQFEGIPRVILLHDKNTTLEHLEKLLIRLTELGYDMKPLTEDMEPVVFK